MVGRHDVLGPRLIDKHPGVALERRAGVVPVLREAVVAEVIAVPVVRIAQFAPALEQQHGLSRLRQPARHHPAGRTRADDDDVVRR